MKMKNARLPLPIKIAAGLGVVYGLFLVASIFIIWQAFNKIFGYDIFANLKPLTLTAIGLAYIICGIFIFRKANWARIGFIVTAFTGFIAELLFVIFKKEPLDLTSYIDLFISLIMLIFIFWVLTSKDNKKYFLKSDINPELS